MTSIQFPCWVIGLMSGTSADGVDAALLYTDGRDIVELGESVSLPYDDATRAAILGLMKGSGDLRAIEAKLTDVHIEAIRQLRAKSDVDVKLIGFHGQTIKHDPAKKFTQQIGEAARMARETGIPVVADFRTNDVKLGGQGAPLVPLYHAALAHDLQKPVMIVNIGGVSNVTWIGEDHEIIAFDAGPGNALLDDWLHLHTGARYDEEGRIAAAGTVDQRVLTDFTRDAFFRESVPKSLDRHHFSGEWVKHLSLEDGAATLTVMTVAAIAIAIRSVPTAPKQVFVTGGGRHNKTMMQRLQEALAPRAIPVFRIEEAGWDGDMLEAQAFAYLATRSVQQLPLSLPTTTGVPQPATGGVFYPAAGGDGS